ncbi:MAG TPA: aspartyl protease family protein [Vicinamibacterales bacterium]|nr:aspartyl protease family protein [Vicinamibacterales bacterium]
MRHRIRLPFVVLALGAALAVGVRGGTSGQEAGVQLQFANMLFDETRYAEALEAFRRAAGAEDPSISVPARIGVVKSALQIGEFADAQREARSLLAVAPLNTEVLTVHADALWSAGTFDEAEAEYRDALGRQPGMSRALHGIARAQASRNLLDEAMDSAQAALRESPRDPEIHHTVGTIFERMRRYEQAAAAYTNYVNLLPNKDHSEKAAWSRAQVRFLKSFGEREPIAIDDEAAERLYTVGFRLVDDKIIVKARVNGQRLQDFVLDTGSEQTTISRQTASAAGVRPITYTLSAGVGEVGLRGLQLGRLDSLEIGGLKFSNVPVMIKAPALRGLPKRETESFSPLTLGMSMIVDYGAQRLTMGRVLPDEPAETHLPMRQHRLSLVRGLLNENHPTYFVIDTGGEVISISTTTAEAINATPTRKIALRVYGSSGWDRDAFLLPGMRLRFADAIDFQNFALVVLNLRAPSVLLGFEVGGIVGHKFLSPYRVALDMGRSEMRLSPTGN